ncbi:hypothetical protein [Stenomitos frigidus]|uniref:Uncharacterized protein n=1 Tax=Stenomitos frigidus ULC18 TaxID=2107698 RepID=A0A2T1DVJ1_9CYAN|nr:hypothetical protein [Stenomitos frigidus]PSB24515.1 hypothetical protein C7B82_26110 [Stenomitos frigidus ULC18]
MRNQRTREEQIVINLVHDALCETGNEVIEDAKFHDKPDWVFSLNGKRVAAECRLIGLQELMKWSNCKREMKPDRNYKITFPLEPHLWMKKAIEDKEGKVTEYLHNSGSEEAWLITHSDFKVGICLYECDSRMLELMKSSAAAIGSRFSNVWFVHPEAGVNRLWGNSEPKVDFPSLDVSSGYYPTASYMMVEGTLTNAGWAVSVGTENTIEHITLQPLDTRYKIEE